MNIKTLIFIVLITTVTPSTKLFSDGHFYEENPIYQSERWAMVELQIQRRGIFNEYLLDVMRSVPKHLFLPDNIQASAYQDSPQIIGFNHTASRPYIVAFKIESAEIVEGDKCLEVGTGPGYQTAIMSELCDEVYSIESVLELGETSKIKLLDLGYDNVTIKIAQENMGWPEQAPFDVIIVNQSQKVIPRDLIKQLEDYGGRLIFPVDDIEEEFMKIIRNGPEIIRESLYPVKNEIDTEKLSSLSD